MPVEVVPLPIYKSVPQGEEVERAFRRLWKHRYGGLSGMRAENLRIWLVAEKQGEDPDTDNCNKVVNLVQKDFREGILQRNAPGIW